MPAQKQQSIKEDSPYSRAEAESWYRGERLVQCTCVPPHEYAMQQARCPEYTKALERLLREIRQTGFIRNTAHKIRARIDALLIDAD